MTTSSQPPADGPSAQTLEETEPSAGERAAWIAKNSKLLIVAVVVLIIAILIAAFSFGLFTSSSANPGNSVASGSMELQNDKDDAAIFTAANVVPGDVVEGTVKLTNVGEAAGDFTLTPSNLVDTPASPPLSGVLRLVIAEDGGEELYNGPMADVVTSGAIPLGNWAAGSEHTFTFTVTFDAAAENEYQEAQSTVDFNWSGVNS